MLQSTKTQAETRFCIFQLSKLDTFSSHQYPGEKNKISTSNTSTHTIKHNFYPQQLFIKCLFFFFLMVLSQTRFYLEKKTPQHVIWKKQGHSYIKMWCYENGAFHHFLIDPDHYKNFQSSHRENLSRTVHINIHLKKKKEGIYTYSAKRHSSWALGEESLKHLYKQSKDIF